jgi:hypothetical protein
MKSLENRKILENNFDGEEQINILVYLVFCFFGVIFSILYVSFNEYENWSCNRLTAYT